MTNCMNCIAVFNKRLEGSVMFHQCNKRSGVTVTFNLKKLPKNKVMAIHIHEYGDLSDGCKSLGGHWNPEGKEHGSIFIDKKNSHAGDLINNLKSDSEGNFEFEYVDSRLNLFGDVKNAILGRSVVIHEGIDDCGMGRNKESKITGNAGKRYDCAIIGISGN